MVGPSAFGQDQNQHDAVQQETDGGDHRCKDDWDRKHQAVLN